MTWGARLSLVWLAVVLVIGLGYLTAWVPYWQAGAYCLLVLMGSSLALLLQTWDKLQARRDGPRIRERWLHLLELCGGWPGSCLAQQWLRHKTSKLAYQRWFWGMTVVHLLLVGIALYFSLPGKPEAAASRKASSQALAAVCWSQHANTRRSRLTTHSALMVLPYGESRGEIFSLPTHLRSTSGMLTEPSAC